MHFVSGALSLRSSTEATASHRLDYSFIFPSYASKILDEMIFGLRRGSATRQAPVVHAGKSMSSSPTASKRQHVSCKVHATEPTTHASVRHPSTTPYQHARQHHQLRTMPARQPKKAGCGLLAGPATKARNIAPPRRETHAPRFAGRSSQAFAQSLNNDRNDKNPPDKCAQQES